MWRRPLRDRGRLLGSTGNKEEFLIIYAKRRWLRRVERRNIKFCSTCNRPVNILRNWEDEDSDRNTVLRGDGDPSDVQTWSSIPLKIFTGVVLTTKAGRLIQHVPTLISPPAMALTLKRVLRHSLRPRRVEGRTTNVDLHIIGQRRSWMRLSGTFDTLSLDSASQRIPGKRNRTIGQPGIVMLNWWCATSVR